jgi:hypothetical protein
MPDSVEIYHAAEAREAKAVADEARRYGDQLVPGAPEVLAKFWGHLGKLPPDRLAEEFASRLAGPKGQPYLNPEARPATLENGQPVGPLRAALIRHADRLKPDVVDALVAKLSPAMIGKKPHQIAGAVVKWLGSRDADDFKPEHTVHSQAEEDLANRVAARFGDLIGIGGARKFARDRARDLHYLPERQLTTIVAKAFTHPAVASKYGAKTIAGDDPRLDGRVSSGGSPAPAQQARNPQGQFKPSAPGRPLPNF